MHDQLQSIVTHGHRATIGPPSKKITLVAADLEAALPEGCSGSSLFYLLSDRQIVVSESVQRYSCYTVKYLTAAGVESGSNIEIEFNPEFETFTLHSLRIFREARWID